MKQSSKIIFFGTEDFSAASLQALLAHSWNITAVVTKPDTPRGRKQVLTAPKVKEIALSHNIEVWQPTKVSEITAQITKLKPDIGVLVSYGKIIPQTIIDLFPQGIVNVHPSLLPKYRGPTPIESAIINGDSVTGISIMSLSAAMDAGPVYHQKHVLLDGTETQPMLYSKLADIGAATLLEVLPAIISGELEPKPQDDAQASYCKLLSKQDSILDLTQPANVLERTIRAYLNFPKSKVNLFDRYEVIITKARVAKSTNDGALVLMCGKNTYLEILELIAPSGKIMHSVDFTRGYPA